MMAIFALGVAATASAAESGESTQLRFPELPFAEGKLFVSVTCGDTMLLAKAVDVEDETLSIPADLSDYSGKEMFVQAFQDLNGNGTLDFDSYGRPQEPCLQTTIVPAGGDSVIDLRLVQY